MSTGGDYWGLEGSKCHSCLQERQEGGCGELQADQPHLSPWEGHGANHMEAVAKLFKGKKITGSSKHGFMKGNWCLTNLIALYNKMTCSMNEQSVVDVVYLSSSATFDTVSDNIFADWLKWSVRCFESWLCCWA